MPDSTSPTTAAQNKKIDITTLLVLALLVQRAGSRPCLRISPALADFFGAEEVLVLDLTQNPTGAYKVSAAALQFEAIAGNILIVGDGALEEAAKREAAGLKGAETADASSTGNFAAAVSLQAAAYKLDVQIFMPNAKAVPKEKRRLVKKLGKGYARAVHVKSSAFDDARAEAAKDAAETGAALLQPYDSALAVLGNAAGVVLAAMTGHLHGFDLVVVPDGGGGLGAGIFLALEAMFISVGERICSEPAVTASLAEAAVKGRPSPVDGAKSLASGANVKLHGSLTWWLLERFHPSACAATELEIAQAMIVAREIDGTIWEGAAALSLVPLLRGLGRGKRVLIVHSGANPSAEEMQEAERLMAESGGIDALKRRLS